MMINAGTMWGPQMIAKFLEPWFLILTTMVYDTSNYSQWGL